MGFAGGRDFHNVVAIAFPRPFVLAQISRKHIGVLGVYWHSKDGSVRVSASNDQVLGELHDKISKFFNLFLKILDGFCLF
jgi:hypothetical protein